MLSSGPAHFPHVLQKTSETVHDESSVLQKHCKEKETTGIRLPQVSFGSTILGFLGYSVEWTEPVDVPESKRLN